MFSNRSHNFIMLKHHTILASVLAFSFALTVPAARADSAVSADPRVKGLEVERSENNLFVSFSLDLSSVKVKSDREVAIFPVISLGDSAVTLPKVVAAGHNRYIQNERKNRLAPGDMLVRPGSTVDYSTVVAYRPWMETAVVSLAEDWCGCGFSLLESSTAELARLDLREKVFAPMWAYVSPRVEARKERSAKGSAYIDFKVNRTEIEPSYRRNPQELAAIRDTIDVIKNDPDARIEEITITGYASPEGPFANNERLAKGRTEALASYVKGLYSFPSSVLRTASVAEDWDGLIRYVEGSDLADREAILTLIAGTDLAPDAREWKLKKEFPEQYRFLLDNVYPGLRHSDYTVAYVISSFADPAKIAEVMRHNPRKLSLHEMYLLAQTLPSDSPEFREVFEVAVRLYPDDPVANLNAAITALSFDDLDNAARFAAKAGDSAEAVYTRGLLAAKQGDYSKAADLLARARDLGLASQADDALAQLRAMGRIK